MKIKKKVYPHDAATARENGELELFRESYKLNVECAGAIDASIEKSRIEKEQYSLADAARDTIKKYGKQRVLWILAATIQGWHYDMRFSNANREWAKSFYIPKEHRIYAKSHPAILDYYITHART